MHTSPPVLADFLRLFIRHPLRWLVPAMLVAAAVSGYAAVKPDAWESSLTLVVRAEASGNQEMPGRFRQLSDMKTLQETFLELAKSRPVSSAALQQVGPPPAADTVVAGDWPTPQDVDDLSDSLKLVPPKGAEFGATEVLYLKIRAASADRANALTEAVAARTLEQFQKVRDEKARSIVVELERAVEIARGERNDGVRELGRYEARVGGDLAELRNLEQLGSGDGDVRRLTVELESEVRQSAAQIGQLRELLTLLQDAARDPSKLLATPNRLLESQPALRRLKDGLVDAQLRTSQLRGSMSNVHPLVRAAVDAEEEVRSRLHEEIVAAQSGVESELNAAEKLEQERRERLEAVHDRLDRLAGLRAEYSALFAENQQRARQLEQAEKQLAEARAAQAGAAASSLIGVIGRPDVGSKPVGPSRKILFAAAVAGGLCVGAGWLLLTTVPPVPGASHTAAAPIVAADGASEQHELSGDLRPASVTSTATNDASPTTVSAA